MSLWRYLLAQSTVLWVLAIVIPRERKLLLPCLKELRLHKNPAAQIIKLLGYFSLSVCWFPKVYTCFFGFGFHGFLKLYYEIFLLFLLQFQILHLPQKYLQPCMIKLHYFFGSIIVSGRWVLIRDVQKKSALIALTNTLPRSSEKWELLQAWPLELSRSWHTCAQSPGNHIEFVILLHIYTDELQVTKAGVASILRKRCSKCFLPCVTCW